jgi:hypothetical protein
MPSSRRPALAKRTQNSTILETFFLVGLAVAICCVVWTYQIVSSHLEKGDEPSISSLPLSLQKPQHAIISPAIEEAGPDDGSNNQHHTMGGLAHFSKLAQDIAALPPEEALIELEKDPFGTRAFDAQLLEHETKLKRILSLEEIQELFPCPTNLEERITLPDVRVQEKAREFREGKRGTFLFFQHLRKAVSSMMYVLSEGV